ncbi:MAG: 5-(carboxyamino)imidazole ribonucleotide synthase [Actinomycetaceae bacterium]|nr:5-(carboxyamino)imidazole ribonucleotide synthase [Actinomycetaceae bacterium]
MDSTVERPVLVAVIGGGQLARMMAESAIALDISLRPLVEAANGATGAVVPNAPIGAANDPGAVATLIDGADVLTFEHEHVPQDLLARIAPHIPIHPSPQALQYAQNKLLMRARLTELGIPCPRWTAAHTTAEVTAFGAECGWPIIAKVPTGGYDGHGVRVVTAPDQLSDWLERGEVLLEEKVAFTAEAAALLARRPSGEIRSWPVATTVQVDGVCSEVIAPSPDLDEATAQRAQEIGEKIAAALDVTGVLAVELFITADGHVLVNELAMRPHNSGHWTIDGAVTSQFEQHLRAVLDLPLGSTEMARPGWAAMVNILGSTRPYPARFLGQALGEPEAKIHLYGKEVRQGRKLGHVTVCDTDPEQARRRARGIADILEGEK